MVETCAVNSECEGPIAADFVIGMKVRQKEAAISSVPLCLKHTVERGLISWVGNQFEGAVRESVGGRRTPRFTHEVVLREPWKSLWREFKK